MGSVPRGKRQRPGIRYTLKRYAKGNIHFSQSYSGLRLDLRGGPVCDGVFANDFVIEWQRNYHRVSASK